MICFARSCMSSHRMARRHIRQHCQHFTEFNSGHIVDLHKAWWSYFVIGAIQTAQCWNQQARNVTHTRSEDSSCPRQNSPRKDRCIVCKALWNPMATAPAIWSWVFMGLFTIYKRILILSLAIKNWVFNRFPGKSLPILHSRWRNAGFCSDRNPWYEEEESECASHN